MMIRRGANIMAEFSDLPAAPSFVDVSAIGRLAVEEFLEGDAYIREQLWFTFSEAPDSEQIHNLTITYTLVNGQTFEGIIENVTILP